MLPRAHCHNKESSIERPCASSRHLEGRPPTIFIGFSSGCLSFCCHHGLELPSLKYREQFHTVINSFFFASPVFARVYVARKVFQRNKKISKTNAGNWLAEGCVYLGSLSWFSRVELVLFAILRYSQLRAFVESLKVWT